MEYITQQFSSAIGTKNLNMYYASRFLRRAYYTANLFVFLIIILVSGYFKFQQFQYQRKFDLFGPGLGRNVINITYAQLGPPPSIIDNEVTISNISGINAGQIKSVADAQVPLESLLMINNANYINIANQPINVTTPVVPFFAVDIKPQPIEIPEPILPPSMPQGQVQGQVLVKTLVDIDGKPIDAQVTRSSGNNSLDQAALIAAMKARFTPAKQNDQYVRVWVSIPFNFYLTDGK